MAIISGMKIKGNKIMQEYKKILKAIKTNRQKEEELNLCRKGYWLVRESDCKRFFISEYVSLYELEKVAEKHLNDKTGYEYWIDYCLGLDVNKVPAWSNIDQVELFF